MHISYATLFLIPAAWAAAIQVSDTVSGIIKPATDLANPSIIGSNPSDVAIRSLAEGLESLNPAIQEDEDNTNSSRDVSIITRRGLIDDLEGILGELDDLKKELTLSYGEAKEKVRQQIREIVDQLRETYQKFIARVKEILSGTDEKKRHVSRSVGKTTDGIQSRNDDIAHELIEILTNLATLGDVFREQAKAVADLAGEEIKKQTNELLRRLNEIKVKITGVVKDFVEGSLSGDLS
ncbi:hypothetical protein V491_02700 [Pseudogymnoascus sp. VKM F-3775]|nr:hypothetical protein V491_02700 [Pseudogymnoascus sp. VKM F-3775]